MIKRIALLLMVLLLLAPGLAEAPEAVQVSYLGPEGTYTQEAAQFFFQDDEVLNPRETVNDAIADVVSEVADYAVIPQENTLGGAVVNYVDALIDARDVYVVGEVILPISQTLMGVPGASLEGIKTVYSHAQGLTQSAQWRGENLPEAAAEETASTAAAASYVAQQQDPALAAIAAPGAAALYGLEVLAKDVQITDANKTRFYVLSMEPVEAGDRAVFVATCDGDMIDDIIIALHEAGLELVSLHDRPEGSRLGSYHYVIEVEDEDGVSEAQIDAALAFDEVRYAGRFDTRQPGKDADADRAEQLAEALLEKAAEVEPEVTALLQSLESEQARLEGLENRLKSLDSLTRKIITNAKDMEVSVEEAAPQIRDVLRYTFVAEDDEYAKATAEVVDAMLAQGYELLRFSNTWTSETYKGINVNFRTGNGVVFELQFHTPKSFEVKMDTHDIYEIIRDENIPEEEKADAYRQRLEITATIPIPEGAEELQYPLSD